MPTETRFYLAGGPDSLHHLRQSGKLYWDPRKLRCYLMVTGRARETPVVVGSCSVTDVVIIGAGLVAREGDLESANLKFDAMAAEAAVAAAQTSPSLVHEVAGVVGGLLRIVIDDGLRALTNALRPVAR